MEQKHVSRGSVCDQLPAMSVKYSWLVAQNLDAEVDYTKDQIFFTMHDPLSFYRCRIPELLGRCIRGYYHGWVILSNHPHNVMWSLWNPVTSMMIRLPPLILKDGDFESIKQCCLSSPPNDPTSVLMLTRRKTPTIVFCRVDHKRKKLRWKEMSYAKQLRNIAVASELGGYMHILGEIGKVIYSYDDKDKTISLSSLSCLEQSTHLSLWECWLHVDQDEIEYGTGFKPADKIMVRPVNDDEAEVNNTRNEATHILNIPLDVWRMIMEFCGCVEYLNFRATCKHFQSAAPIIRWSNETSLRRLQTYSFSSPWLLVFDKHRGIITFTDPMFGDEYYMKTPKKLIGDLRIYCSMDGWLLLYKLNGPGEMFFFNPFTKDIRELPNAPYLDSLVFLGTPTSPNCMVTGLSASLPMNFFIYSLTWESSSWARYRMDFGDTTPHSFLFPTIYSTYTFALNQGALNLVLENDENDALWNAVIAEAPRGSSALYYLANCSKHLRLVVMDELGESVEVFKFKFSAKEWKKIDNLGRHMIYISGTMCFCMEAKTREMENKIYFPRLDSEYGKIVFYSLETRRYHTFNGQNIQQCFKDFVGTKYHVYPHAWIQPSWS